MRKLAHTAYNVTGCGLFENYGIRVVGLMKIFAVRVEIAQWSAVNLDIAVIHRHVNISVLVLDSLLKHY
jgi:hypothetical protein